jgi:hypothetical protein
LKWEELTAGLALQQGEELLLQALVLLLLVDLILAGQLSQREQEQVSVLLLLANWAG